MGPKGTLRAIEAAERRAEREAQRRKRELERRAKEQAKLSELEMARLEVETHENQVEVLLSMHKTQGKSWDWLGILASLAPPRPERNSFNELRARQQVAVWPAIQKSEGEAVVEHAKSEDDQIFQQALQSYADEAQERSQLRPLARRILDGEAKAFTQALSEFSAFREISELGSSINVTVHSPKFLECEVSVNGSHVIPTEVKP